MLRYIKKTLLIIAISFALISAFLVGIAFFYGQELTKLVIAELNKQLLTEVKISAARISFIRSFPNAQISFSDVSIAASKLFVADNQNELAYPLLTAKKLNIEFNIYNIWNKRYIINGLSIKDASINIVYSKNGIASFLFWDSKTKNSDALTFNLKRIGLNNVQFFYADLANNFETDTHIESLKALGKIDKTNWEFRVKSSSNNLRIYSGNKSYKFINELEVNTKISSVNGVINFNKTKLLYQKFTVFSELQLKNENYTFNAKVNEVNYNEIATLLKLLQISNIKAENGTVAVEGKAWGRVNDILNSNISAALFLKGLHVNELEKWPVYNLSGKLQLDYNPVTKTWYFTAPDANALLHNVPFKIAGSFSLGQNNNLALRFSANAPWFHLKNFADTSIIAFSNGEVGIEGNLTTVANAGWTGSFSPAFLDLVFTANLNNVNFVALNKQLKVNNLTTVLHYSKSLLVAEKLNAEVNTSDINFSGKISGFDFFAQSENANYNISGKINAKNLYADSLLITGGSADKANYSVNANVEVNCENLHYQKVHAKNFKANCVYTNEQLAIYNLHAKVFSGSVANGRVEYVKVNNVNQLYSNLEINGIDISTLFNTFNNFGQSQLLAENIAGKLSGHLSANVFFDSKGNIIKEIMKAEADIVVDNGLLKDFKPVSLLSKYIGVDDVNNIKFNKLVNKISLANGTITIPKMEIASTAINLSLSGTHTLTNTYDYRFDLLLSDILFKKAKSNRPVNSEFGPVEEDSKGHTRLFLRLSGTGDVYRISYDSREAVKSFTKRIASEKDQIKSIFKKEFGTKNSGETAVEPGAKPAPAVLINETEFAKPKPAGNNTPPANVKKKPAVKIEWDDK